MSRFTVQRFMVGLGVAGLAAALTVPATAGLSGAGASSWTRTTHAQREGDGSEDETKHVLLISVDGLHQGLPPEL